MKYGRLTIVDSFSRKRKDGKAEKWVLCKCDCGNEKEIREFNVKTGKTKSCGCLVTETLIKRNWKHGKRSHPAYNTYSSMIKRCYNEKTNTFHNYGGRGIKVCDEWKNDITSFLEWCEENGFSKELQLDRRDNNGNYSPENCRFVTPTVNLRNTRRNVMINGISLREHLDIIGEKYNIGFPTLRYRYYTIKKEGLEPNEHNLVHNKRWLK